MIGPLVAHSAVALPLVIVLGWLGVRRDLDLGWMVRIGVLLMAIGFGLSVLDGIDFDVRMASMLGAQLAVAVGLLLVLVGWQLRHYSGGPLRKLLPYVGLGHAARKHFWMTSWKTSGPML